MSEYIRKPKMKSTKRKNHKTLSMAEKNKIARDHGMSYGELDMRLYAKDISWENWRDFFNE